MYSRSLSLAACLPVIAASLPACNAPSSEPVPRPAASEAAAVVLAEVKWPDPASADAAAVAALPEAAAERVRASRVPVLVPRDVDLLRVAHVATRPTWTTVSMRAGGVNVVVTASSAARAVPGVEPVKGNVPVRGGLGFVSRNELIWRVAWTENEVAYAVEVECDRTADARCADDAFVTRVTRELVFAGGSGAGAGKGGAQ